MNRGLIIIKGPPPGKFWPEGFMPETIGPLETVRRMISAYLYEVKWLEPQMGTLETDKAFLLFVLRENAEGIDSIYLEMGSRGKPVPLINLLCEKYGWCVFDKELGEFVVLEPARKWWQLWK